MEWTSEMKEKHSRLIKERIKERKTNMKNSIGIPQKLDKSMIKPEEKPEIKLDKSMIKPEEKPETKTNLEIVEDIESAVKGIKKEIKNKKDIVKPEIVEGTESLIKNVESILKDVKTVETVIKDVKNTKNTAKSKPTAPINTNLRNKVMALSKAYKSIGDPEFVKSGSLVMDALMGGGVPRGCFILWSSASGIGKSTGSMYIAKSYCVQGMKVLYLDFEGGVNVSQLSGIGLMEHLYDEVKNPNGTFYCYRVQSYVDAEAFLDAMMVEMDLIIIDSVTSILPEKIKSESVEKILPGLQSRLMSNLLLKYKATSMKNGTSWIMINQIRTHIRFVGMTTDEEAGGNALKFFSDYRIIMKEAKNGKLVKNEMTPLGTKKVPYGSINEIWCLKSRYSRPFIPLKLGIVFGKGISNSYAYMDFLNFKGCIKREGGWYTIEMAGLNAHVQGEIAVIDWITENKEAVKKFIEDNGKYRLLMDDTDAIMTEDNYEMFADENNPAFADENTEAVVFGNIDEEQV